MTDLPSEEEPALDSPAPEGGAETGVPELLERVEECLGALAAGSTERVHEVQELLRALRREAGPEIGGASDAAQPA